jgi:hypothetical protein
VLQWSDLARNPRQIAEIVERDGEARIERRGDAQLVLVESKRYENTRAYLDIATQLLRNVLRSKGVVEVAVRQTFPWTIVMPESACEQFFEEFAETFEACEDLDVWVPLEQLVHEWKATAAIYADPELAAELSRPIQTTDDSVVVPRPEAPGAEAW